MSISWRPCRHRPQRHHAIGLLGGLSVLSGCQSYEPAPLNLDAHREALTQRLADVESVESFMARLEATGAATPTEFSLADGLTAAEAEVLALFYNPDLRIARLDANIALAAAEYAGLWEDPVFGFDGTEITSASVPFEYGLTLTFSIPISGRLQVEREKAEAAVEAQRRAVVDQEWAARAAVRAAWVRWTTARAQIETRRSLVEELEAIVAVTDRLRDAGEISRADARVFAVALIDGRADLLAAEAVADGLAREIRYLLGMAMDAEITLIPGLPPSDPPRLTGDLEDRLIRHNTRLAVRRAEYAVAEEALRLEIRKQIPDLEFGGGYGSEDDDRLLLGVRLPIPVLNANRQAIATADAERERSRAIAEVTFERLAHDLVRAMIEYREANARRTLIESRALSLATEQLAELQHLATLGDVNTLLLLESLTSLYKNRTEILEQRQDEHLAAIRIVELLGPDTGMDPAPVAEPAPVDATEAATPGGDQ